MTEALAKEMFNHLDTFGEHSLVSNYKGVVSDDYISRIIEAWACSIKPLEVIIEDYWNRHQKIYK